MAGHKPVLCSARSWYHSPEYEQFKSIRLGTTTGRAILVEGIN
ncbi:TPA: DUF1330 domain-containing protein [Haemophilus influenzae]